MKDGIAKFVEITTFQNEYECTYEGAEDVSIELAASGEFPCVTNGPLEATFWVMFEREKEYPDPWLTTLGRFPFPFQNKKSNGIREHSIQFEINEIGLEELLGIPSYSDPDLLQKWMLDEGICPFQPFKISGKMIYTCDYWGEHDSYFEWDIVEKRETTIDGKNATEEMKKFLKNIEKEAKNDRKVRIR